MQTNNITAKEIKFISSDTLSAHYGIDYHQQLTFIDEGRLSAYKRQLEVLKNRWPDMRKCPNPKCDSYYYPDMDECEDCGHKFENKRKRPKDYWASGKTERSIKYQRLSRFEMLGLTVDKIKELYFSETELLELRLQSDHVGLKKSEDLASENKSNVVQNSFTKTGDVWEIRYGGQNTILKDLERIRCIIHLLNNPDKEFFPTELRKLVKQYTHGPDEMYEKMCNEQLEIEGVSLENLPIEILSLEDKRRLETQANDVWENLKVARSKGDPKRISQRESEWHKLKGFFQKEYGVGIIKSDIGLSFYYRQRLKERAEKDRINLYKQINQSKEDIKKEIPSLYEHLNRFIKTGNRFGYSPDPEGIVDWEVTF